MNKFYIIAMPIGNMEEISSRTIFFLKKINIFFCEDTRKIKKIFNILNISISNKKFYKCDIFSELDISKKILKILENDDCALVSDAGYPMISDPGYLIKKNLYKNNIFPIIINGSCSIIHALVTSNISTNNFYFYGFLNKKRNKKINELNKIKEIKSVIVIFESPHKLVETLIDIQSVFGNIYINICKELTKINEKIYYDKISNLLSQIDLRGEFVLVFENFQENEINYNNYFFEIDILLKKNIKLKDACRMVAYKFNLKTNTLFDLYENKKANNE